MYLKGIIVGYLGGNPEMRYTPSGTPVTNFSLAVNRRWNNADGEPQERTLWVRVAAWRKLAEVCNQYLSKGRLVLVEFDWMDASAWANKETGEPMGRIEVTARSIKFLGGNGGDQKAKATDSENFVGSEEIPF